MAAALLNSGEPSFRSSVGGELRGPVCGMGVCYECRVTIDGIAHQRACLRVVAQRDADRDGEARMPDSSREFDVVIVGAGPAGIAAACRAAEAGRRSIVLDEGLGPGGQIWRPQRARTARRRRARIGSRGSRPVGAVVQRSTSVFDVRRTAAGGFLVSGEHDGRAFEVTGRAIILATGARERFLPFPGWTLPNVVGIGGAQALLKAGTSFVGKRVVIAGSGPLLLPVAASLAKSGAKVALVAEQAAAQQRSQVRDGTLATSGDADASRAASKRVPHDAVRDGHVGRVGARRFIGA